MNALEEFCLQFQIADDIKDILKKKFAERFEQGLDDDPNVYKFSPVKMLPTYISIFEEKEHSGSFFSIDFGGTNLRIVKITLNDGVLTTEPLCFVIPEYIKSVEGDDLFEFIASKLEHGLKKFGMENTPIKYVGFTFSFPCAQKALNHGNLIAWTKGFCNPNVQGKDVVEKMKAACKTKLLKVDDFCLLNDTTGTLLCGSYEDRKTYIGLINGTGTNACYLEKTKNVKKIEKCAKIGDSVIINTEWGSFGDHGSLKEILTEFDVLVDNQSINPGSQILEKCVSGMYLPEIVRLIIVNKRTAFNIFLNNFPTRLLEPYSLKGKFLSLIYDQDTFVTSFNKKFKCSINNFEFQYFYVICEAIVKRASIITALALSALFERIDAQHIVIAADGSICRKHPVYLLNVSQELKNHTNKTFEFSLVSDGSGKGSALAACIASQN